MTTSNPAARDGRRTIDFIQALRGIAALAVVILHSGWDHADYATNHSVRDTLSSGILGVDLFFIISGFIMCYTIPASSGGWRDASRFAVKRWTRIWPLYLVCTLAIALLVVWLPIAGELRAPPTVHNLLSSLAFLPTSMHFFAPTYTLPVLGVGWTLNYEMYFYAALCVCLCTGRWKWLSLVAWLVGALLVIPWLRGCLTLDANLAPNGDTPLLNTMTSPIMWEFAAGVFIAGLYKRGVHFARVRTSLIMAGAAVSLLVVECSVATQIKHGLTDEGLPVLLIFLALALAPPGKLRVWAPLVWLGKISFSLYLVHEPVRLVLGTLLSIRGVRLDPVELTVWIVVMCMVSIAVAGVSYRYLEAGLSNRLRNTLLARIPKPTASSARECA